MRNGRQEGNEALEKEEDGLRVSAGGGNSAMTARACSGGAAGQAPGQPQGRPADRRRRPLLSGRTGGLKGTQAMGDREGGAE